MLFLILILEKNLVIYTGRAIRGLPFERWDIYVERSPFYHVDKLEVPLLVHVATNDTDVNYEEASMLIEALRAQKPNVCHVKPQPFLPPQ